MLSGDEVFGRKISFSNFLFEFQIPTHVLSYCYCSIARFGKTLVPGFGFVGVLHTYC